MPDHPSGGSRPAAAAPDRLLDDPTVLVPEAVDHWALGGGMLYWTKACSDREFGSDGYLRRQPSHGGGRRTLDAMSRGPCRTPLQLTHLAADDSGLYDYNADLDRIERHPVGSPGTVTTVYNTPLAPVAGLATNEDWVFWATSGAIVQALKTGSTPFTVSSTAANPTDLLVLEGSSEVYAYWLDDGGLWRAQANCVFGGCPPKVQITGTRGSSLIVRPNHDTHNYDLDWIATGTPNSVVRHSCGRDGCAVDTLYTAPEDQPWELGELVTNGTYLYWKEQASGGAIGPRLRRMNADGGAAVTIAEGLPYGDQHLAVDDLGVYYYGLGGISRLPFEAGALARDLKAETWEVTQGVQTLATSPRYVDFAQPLVAGKPTYVRVYGLEASGPSAAGVEAHLVGSRGGTPLAGSPLKPLNGTLYLETGQAYRRDIGMGSPGFLIDANPGWLFALPPGWIGAGTISLQAVVDPRERYLDPDRSNNTLSRSFTFTHKAPVCPVFVPVRTAAPGASTGDANFWRMIDLFRRLWPISEVWVYSQGSDIAELETCWKAGVIPYPCFGPYELNEDDSWKVIASLISRDTFSDDPDECDAADARTHYVGMVHPDASTGTQTGFANFYLAASWVKLPPHDADPPTDWRWPASGATMAQELAHNYNRRHAGCGATADLDPKDSLPDCKLDVDDPMPTYGRAPFFGFDVNTLTPIKPTDAADFMSYGSARWASHQSWGYLRSDIKSSAAVAAGLADRGGPLNQSAFKSVTRPSLGRHDAVDARQASANFPAAGPVVMASGVISPSLGQGHLNYTWVMTTGTLSQGMRQKWQALAAPRVTTAPAWLAFQSGVSQAPAYHLRLIGPANAVLDDRAVTLLDNAIHHPDEPRFANFALTFAAPAAAVARLELMQDNLVLDSLQPGPSAPTVAIVQPLGGERFEDEMTVVWQATDADPNDHLLFAVQYSPDAGASWRALATDFPSPEDAAVASLTIRNLNGLPGSLQGALVRVAASDGYHTAVAVSAPFQVPNRPPQPYILSPLPRQVTPAGRPILLRGGAMDAEDGGLGDDALHWTVDDRVDGSGQERRLEGLAPGDHLVTLAAHDAAQEDRTTRLQMTVAPLTIPVGVEPLLNGACDDSSYAGGTTVPLAPYGGGEHGAVHFLRTATDLWACFANLDRSPNHDGAEAALVVDANDSRNPLAQPGDLRFAVAEDGSPVIEVGDGAGGFAAGGPGGGTTGLVARIGADTVTWSAEMRIAASALGGWGHPVGLAAGHYGVQALGDDYQWPYLAGWNKPSTWAHTVLAALPAPSPTPTAANLPTPSPTPTAAGTPSAGETGTPTPTPVDGPNPSATPTPVSGPNPTATATPAGGRTATSTRTATRAGTRTATRTLTPGGRFRIYLPRVARTAGRG